MSIEFVRCPFCANRKILHSDKYDGGEYRWGELTILPTEFPLIKTYYMQPGPGRGHKIAGEGGLRLVDEFSIIEMLNHPEYANQAEQMIHRLKQIFLDYIAAGIFDISEFL